MRFLRNLFKKAPETPATTSTFEDGSTVTIRNVSVNSIYGAVTGPTLDERVESQRAITNRHRRELHRLERLKKEQEQ